MEGFLQLGTCPRAVFAGTIRKYTVPGKENKSLQQRIQGIELH